MARKHAKERGGGPTRAIEELTAAGVPFTVHEYEHDPAARAFVQETVEKLGIDPTRVFKTLMVRLAPSGEFVVGCVPALTHLSMKLIARAAGAKSAAMADPALAQRRTGYVVGGISPLGQTTSHRTFIDSSCLDHETVIVSGGRRGLSVELSPLDLADLAGAQVADLAALACGRPQRPRGREDRVDVAGTAPARRLSAYSRAFGGAGVVRVSRGAYERSDEMKRGPSRSLQRH